MFNIFNNNMFGGIRALVDSEGEPWFIGSDIVKALGYKRTNDAVRRHVDYDDKVLLKDLDTPKRRIFENIKEFSSLDQNHMLINESGLYSLIMKSNNPIAKPFQKWLTKEVIPSIRKHGGYILNQELMEDKELEQATKDYLESIKTEHKQFIEADDSLMTFCQASKMLKTPSGGEVGRTNLLKFLRENKVVAKNHSNNNVPIHYYSKAKWFEVKADVRTNHKVVNFVTLLTPKGLVGIQRLINKHWNKAA